MLVNNHFIANASPIGQAVMSFLTTGISIDPDDNHEFEIENADEPPVVTFNLYENLTDNQLEKQIKKERFYHLKN